MGNSVLIVGTIKHTASVGDYPGLDWSPESGKVPARGTIALEGAVMHMTPFDWILVACVGITAVYQAREAVMRRPNRRRLSALLGFVPLGLMIVATIILVGRTLEIGPFKEASTPAVFIKWPDPYRPTTVIGKTFRSETVLLDGISYSGCEFYDVTFLYNGTTPVQFTNNKVFGRTRFRSDNVVVEGAILWMRGFGVLKPDVPIDLPKGNINSPPTFVVPETK